MPHSNKPSIDSDLSFDLLGPMNAAGPYPSFNKPGTAVTSSGHSNPLSSRQANAWKRASLPVSDSYANLMAKPDVDELRGRRAGDRSSMGSFYDNGSRQRIAYYEDQFKYKDTSTGIARERVQRDSPVIAELRTNVIIKDEFTLVTDLSFHLAARYARPDSSIMVKVDHSACLAMGGTFDPCYIMTITAVPSLMGPTMNKRNASLIQSFMADILSVSPNRGIVKFQSVQEENFATNGSTLLGEIEKQEKQQPNGTSTHRSATNASRKSIPSFKKGTPNGTDTKTASQDATGNLGRAKSTTEQPSNSGFSSVFELSGETESKRPSTSHGGADGLRMNGISSQDLTANGTANKKPERPKSMVADAAAIQAQLKDIKAQPMPAFNVHQRPQPQRTGSQSSIKKERTSSITTTKSTNGAKPSQGARHSQIASPDKPKPRDSYLDGFVGTSISSRDLEPTIAENHAAEKLAEKKDTTANTAKRRSNLTATPKMPSPPPIPNEATSVKSLKVGKRKSFLSALRRTVGSSSS